MPTLGGEQERFLNKEMEGEGRGGEMRERGKQRARGEIDDGGAKAGHPASQPKTYTCVTIATTVWCTAMGVPHVGCCVVAASLRVYECGGWNLPCHIAEECSFCVPQVECLQNVAP
jgi:hypothetical protein